MSSDSSLRSRLLSANELPNVPKRRRLNLAEKPQRGPVNEQWTWTSNISRIPDPSSPSGFDWITARGVPYVFIEIRPSPLHGLGAFAKQAIEAWTWVGNYTGKLVDWDAEGDYVLHVDMYDDEFERRRVRMTVDASDANTSSWCRYINSVKKEEKDKQNCRFFINGDVIGVETTRRILKDEELLVYYGDDYVFEKK